MIIDILKVIGSVSSSVITVMTQLEGFECDVYFPTNFTPDGRNTDSIYGAHSNNIKYNPTPNLIKQKYLVLGVFKDLYRGAGTIGYDSFFEDEQPFILTLKEREIPPHSKVFVYFGNARMSFRTEIGTVLNGADGPLFIKQHLKPLT